MSLGTILFETWLVKGEIQQEFISTNDQPADVLTKAATVDKIEWFKKQKDYKLRGVLEINL